MSEQFKYKLRVPKKPAAEYVSQGNFGAELKPNGIVETPSRRFADWLIETHGLTEIEPKATAEPEAKSTEGGEN